MKDAKLADSFVVELFKAAFNNENVFEILIKHLKYSYLTFDYEKKFWKKCLQLYYDKNRRPSLGLVQANLKKEEDVRDFIYEIKQADEVNIKDLVITLQEYIKESMYVEAFDKSAELFNRGEQDNAMKVYREGARQIEEFSLQDKIYDRALGGFEDRMIERQNPENQNEKVPFYIDELDRHTHGGPERGETVLFLAESGIGKSQALIHYAIRTAVAGGNVLYFQIEGTKKQILNRIDAAWSGLPYHDIKNGEVRTEDTKKTWSRIHRALKNTKGEIFVDAVEEFGGISTMEILQSAKEAKKLYGDIKLIIIDYLELCELKDGITYGPSTERFRQSKIGQHMKEIAMKIDCVVATVTQASNLPLDLKNDSGFVMTREYLAEDKGKIRPFDFFYTFNQTLDEKKHRDENGKSASVIRIFADKLRDYESAQTTTIVTNFSRSRFYDKNKTLEYEANHDEL